MRIHTRIIIDMKSGTVLEDEFYEYIGELALCDGDASGGGGESGFSGGVGGDFGIGTSFTGLGDYTGTIGSDYGLSGDFSDYGGDLSGIEGDFTSSGWGDFTSSWGVESGLGGLQGEYDFGGEQVSKDAVVGSTIANIGFMEAARAGKDVDSWSSTFLSTIGFTGLIGATISVVGLNALGKRSLLTDRLGDLTDWTSEEIETNINTYYSSKGVSESDWSALSGESGNEAQQAAEKKFYDILPQEQQKEIQTGAVMADINTLLGQEQVGTNVPLDIQALMDKSLADLVDISDVHTMAELTGELSTSERELLDRMRTNSIANLSEVVNEETEDLIKSKIADLTNRGVLAGNVATQALADIDKYRTQQIVRGTRDIETFLAGKELGMIGEQKGRQIDLWELEAKTDLLKAGLVTDWERTKLTTAGQMAGQQTQWDIARLGALTDIYGIEKTGEWKGADIALGYAQTEAQKSAAEEANIWGAIGNIGSGLGMGLAYSLWS